MNRWIVKLRKKLIKDFGGRCQKCGSVDKLVFHHTEPTKLSGSGRGRKERCYDVVHNPKSYQLLCGDCHAIAHNG